MFFIKWTLRNVSALLIVASSLLLIQVESAAVANSHSVLERPSKGSFRRLKTSFEFGRSGHGMSLLSSGNVLISGGGWGDFGGEPKAEILSPLQGKISTLESSLSVPRSGAAQLTLRSGQILLLGGASDFEEALNSTEIFSEVNNEFSPGPLMNFERSGQTATLLPDGRVLVVGGLGSRGCVHQTMELFDPLEMKFSLLKGKLSTPRMNHTATLLDENTLLIVGGESAQSCDGNEGEDGFLDTAEIIDLKTFESKLLETTLASPRVYHTSTQVRSGQVVIAGGIVSLAKSTPLIEVFDANTKRFISAGALLKSRAMHSTNVLTNGEILIAGGVSDGIPQKSSERCSINEGGIVSCRFDSEMSVARWMHSSLVLPTGHVLIAGGLTHKVEPGQKHAGPSRSAELFKP